MKFYFEGDPYFADLWQELLKARTSIYIEAYILENDRIGQKLHNILLQKAKAGVTVKLLVDGIGSWSLPKAYKLDLIAAGAKVKTFHPFTFLNPFHKRINQRDHRKVVIIDSLVAFTGGINLFEEASEQYRGNKAWRDTHLKTTDPHLIAKLNYFFLRTFKESYKRYKKMERFSTLNDIVATRNIFGKNQIRKFILRYIKRSHSFVHISTAYFIPDIEIMLSLRKAIKKGVSVKIITSSPENTDVSLVNRIQHPIFKYLIKRGVKIYYYTPRMMHAKSVIFDQSAATVGSANFNYRSFFRDLEINVFLRRGKGIKILERQFQEDLKYCREVTLAELNQRPILERFIDACFYLIRSFF